MHSWRGVTNQLLSSSSSTFFLINLSDRLASLREWECSTARLLFFFYFDQIRKTEGWKWMVTEWRPDKWVRSWKQQLQGN
jgi:hypothetical protein